MSPNKGETAVHGCHYPGDMVKCACLRYWPGRGFNRGLVYVSVCVPLAWKFVLFYVSRNFSHIQEANQRGENYQGLIHEVHIPRRRGETL